MVDRAIEEGPAQIESGVRDGAFGQANEVRDGKRRQVGLKPGDDEALGSADLGI